MKKILVALVLSIPASARAAGHTITYTTPQETAIQTRLLPLINTAKCASRGLGPSCNSAALVANGCVAVAFPSVKPLYNTCTIYTLDAAGIDAYLQDRANKALVDDFIALNNSDSAAYITPCNASSAAAKANACAAVGAPATCNPCGP